MRKKSKMQKKDYCTLLIIFGILLVGTTLFIKNTYRSYEQKQIAKGEKVAKIAATSFMPDLSWSENIIKEIKRTTISANGQVNDFQGQVRQMANNYLVGEYLIPVKGQRQDQAQSGKIAFSTKVNPRLATYAQKQKATVFQGEVKAGGKSYLLAYQPVFRQGKYWGLAGVAVETKAFFYAAQQNLQQVGYNYQILKSKTPTSKQFQLLMQSQEKVTKGMSYSFQPDAKCSRWKIVVSPAGGWTYRQKALQSSTFVAILMAAIFLICVLLVRWFAHIRQIKEEATIDSLTGIYNRLGFEKKLRKFIESKPNSPFTVAMIDIDDFKLFNDLYGHQVGDQVLKQVAKSLSQVAREKGIVGRTGGDEFRLAFLGLTAEESEQFINRITQADYYLTHYLKQIRYSLSIGYADSPRQGTGMRQLLNQADEALYDVKLSGKGQAQRYSGQGQKHLRAQLGFTLHDIASNIPVALMIYSQEDGRILFVNQGTLQLLGYDNLWDFYDEVNTQAVHVVAPRDLQRVTDWLKKFKDNQQESDQLKYRVINRGGGEIKVLANFHLVENPHYGPIIYQTLMTI